MKSRLLNILNDTLMFNSLNMMLSAGVTALFGFVFWTIVAHSFNSQVVGVATTLLSMSGLISLLGLAGFDTVFIRFLPRSNHRNEQINTGLMIAGLVTAMLSVAFCALVPVLSPKLLFIDKNIWAFTSFILFTVLTTWNTLTNAILVAYRRTSFVVTINVIFSAIKMVLPFAIHSGGAITIFVFAGVAQAINVLLSIASLMKYFDYSPSLKINFDIVHEIRHFGTTAYIANILNLLPDSALPLIVINKIGPSAAAYFYIAFTIANLLYQIVFATTQVLLAEASYEETGLLHQVRESAKIITYLLLPATVILYAFCPLILSLFGSTYRSGAVSVLRIFSLSSFLVMLYSLQNFVFKHSKNMRGLLSTTSANAISIVVLSLLLARAHGLVGIGWAWLAGTCVAVLAGIPFTIARIKGAQ